MGYSRTILALKWELQNCAPALTSGERKVHRDLGLDLDWFVVEDVGTITPLDDRSDGCANQQGMASKDPQAFDRALPADHGLQHYRSLNAGASRQRRVLGLYSVNEVSLPHTRESYRVSWWRWRR